MDDMTVIVNNLCQGNPLVAEINAPSLIDSEYLFYYTITNATDAPITADTIVTITLRFWNDN